MADGSQITNLEKSIRQKLLEIESNEYDQSDLQNLKRLIHLQLSEKGVQSRILNAISQHKLSPDSSESNTKQKLQKDDIYTILRKEGVLKELLHDLKKKENENYKSNTEKIINPLLDIRNISISETGKTNGKNMKQNSLIEQRRLSEYYLRFQVIQGKAFVEYLLEPTILNGQPTSYLTLYIYFRGQKFKCHPTPVTCEPHFSFDATLQIYKSDITKQILDPGTLLAINDPIHIILIKTDFSQNQFLVSSHFVEWRQVLSKFGSKLSIPIELPGIGVENKVPAGMLEASIELQPPLAVPLEDSLVSAQLALEHNRKTERDRLFLAYAKLWWREYIDMRSEHKMRLVKIFAQDENSVVRPVFSYVHRLTTNRFLETPQESAWFVSLLKQQNLNLSTNVDRTKHEQWNNLSTLLCLKEGDCENHAVLLCSLLLGFGLDAYVSLGTLRTGKPCSWVLTIGREKQITFWDCLTAARYKHVPVLQESEQNTVEHSFKTIGCLFNDQRFFANCQPTDAVELCSFELEDSEKWKAMSTDAIQLVSSYIPTLPIILPSSLNPLKESFDMEEQLKQLIIEHRTEKKLSTFWDENLCYLLSSALANYEYQGKTGILNGDEDFHDAIYRVVPEGHTFKALPVHFLHRNTKQIISEILQNHLGKEIVYCRGDMVRLAARVRVYTYVENVVSVWVMIAVKYKPVL